MHKFYFIIILACCSAATIAKSRGRRSVGGSIASLGQFPYQVSIRQYNQHFCGGSIIYNHTILTAAHCLRGFDISETTVVVGTNTLNSGGVVHTVSSATQHALFDTHDMVLNDIGIIRVVEPIQYNDYVQPISLATSPTSEGSTLTVSGWGYTYFSGSVTNNLMYLKTESLDLQTCALSFYGNDSVGSGHICTNNQVNQGVCYGDSGGPLVNEYGEQVGIVSWSHSCAIGAPDVYTSAQFYTTWIYNNA